MRIFCSYEFTGEDTDALKVRMRMVVDALTANGHDAYCPLFDLEKAELHAGNDIPGIFKNAFEHILQQDAVVVIIASERRSEGQLMEIGAALSHNIPIFTFRRKTIAVIPSHVPLLASRDFIWETDDELEQRLKSI